MHSGYDTTMFRLLHVVALLTAAVAAPAGCDDAASHAPATGSASSPSSPEDSRDAARPRRTVADIRPIAGVALNCHHISDLPLYLESVDRIADLGANSLIVVTPMFQDRADSNAMRIVEHKCPTDDQLVAILRRAGSRGLHTTLLPIVLIEHPGEGDWRGTIEPDDWDQWWTSYAAFTDYFLDVARRGQVDLLSIGSELNTTEDQVERWRRIVDRTRDSFRGQITYSANWDRYDKVAFWPMLDVISVSSYFEIGRALDEDQTPTAANLADAWRNERRRLLACADRYDRPLLLSEVGYPSVPWAARHPWNYVVAEGATADHAAQALCWRAFFLAWTDVLADPGSPAVGLYVYAWDPYHRGQPSDTGYGIHGKPAEHIIRNAFKQLEHAKNNSN